MGFVWEDYIFNDKYKKSINISVYIFGGICILAGILTCFAQFVLPAQTYADFIIIKWFSIALVLIFGISSLFCAIKKSPKGVFATYVLFILVTSAFGTKLFYNMDYEFGQNDLMKFAKFSRENGKKLVVLNDERKYSVLYYYGVPTDMKNRDVLFISLGDKDEMTQLGHILDDKNIYVIIRKKQIQKIDEVLDFDIIQEGRKHLLVKVH